jgi:O-antigen/teichoic acid export membrane protein
MIFIINFAFADFFATFVFNRPNMSPYIRIASVAVVFQVIFTTATSAFVGLDKTEYNALAKNVQAVAKAIISVALVLLGLNVAGAVIGHVASFVIAGVVSIGLLFFLLHRTLKTEGNSSFARDLKILVSYGIPLYVAILLTGFVLPYQNLILAMFTSDIDIGNFKAAANFIALITVFSIPIRTTLLPAFSKLNSSTSGKIREFFKLANKYTAMLVVPIAILIMTFSNEIVQIVYGSTFQSASLFLSIYCPLYFLVGIGYLTLSTLFNGLGETRITLRISLINVLIFVVLAPLSASIYGVPGLIIAFLISNTIGTSYGSYIARTKFKIEFDTRSLIKIYLVSIISSIPALLLLQFASMPKLFSVTAGGLLYLFTYATLTPLTRAITSSELDKATDILQKIKPLNYIVKPLIHYQKKILSYRKPADSPNSRLESS